MSRARLDADAVVVGAGPAGLMAAEVLAGAGRSVVVIERKRSPGRKLLLAGRGGLNLTHTGPIEDFLARYGEAAASLAPAIAAFGPDDLRAWSSGLGEPTFVGSSGRVFPRSLRATPLLRGWLRRLADLGVEIRAGSAFTGWSPDGAPVVDGEGLRATATLLAMGGASWPGTGSDGGWVPVLRAAGVEVHDLRPANCAFIVDWSPLLRDRFAGTPLKNVVLSGAGRCVRGEMMISAEGIEGGAVYALSAALRDQIDREGEAVVHIDLRADVPLERLVARLEAARPGQSVSSLLRKAAGVEAVGAALLREARRDLPRDRAALAALVKAVPLHLLAPAPIERAISSAGGIALCEVDQGWMLRKLPGTFVAGEMLDWEAPTGGYLLQATFATAVAAARSMLGWIGGHPPV